MKPVLYVGSQSYTEIPSVLYFEETILLTQLVQQNIWNSIFNI